MCVTKINASGRISDCSPYETITWDPISPLNPKLSKVVSPGMLDPANDNCTTEDTVPWYNLEMDANNQYHPMQLNSSLENTSVTPFPNSLWIVAPDWELAVKTSAFIPLILCGIIGNSILLNIILKNKSLRTPTNLLIANMATTDLITIVVCPVMFLIHDFFQNYQLGLVGCKLEGFLDGSLLVTEVLTLTAISYDRLTAIVLPQETRLTLYGAKILIGCTWVGGFVLAIPFSIYRNYKERQWINFLETYCSEDKIILPTYWHVLIATIVWLPLAVMLICYSAIFWKLERYEAQVLRREHPLSVRYKTKVARMLFIVVITFIICRVPFTALVFIRNEMQKSYTINQVEGPFSILWFTAHYLIFFNVSINPIIYGFTNENFKKAFKTTSLFRFLFGTKEKLTKQVKAKYRLPAGPLTPRGPCGQDDKILQQGFWIFRTNRNKVKTTDSINSKKSSSKDNTNEQNNSSKLTPLPITQGFI